MNRAGVLCLTRGAILVVAAQLALAIPAVTQEPLLLSGAPLAKENRNASVNLLEAQIQQLNASLVAMHQEIMRSRREVRELNRELGTARGQLASFKRELADLEVPSRNSSSDLAPEQMTHSDRAHPQYIPQNEQSRQLEEQVENLKENQQLLKAQVEDQYQTKVESASKYRVRLSGIALFNLSRTRGYVDDVDLPTSARPRGILDSSGSFAATARQSLLGLEVFGPIVGGARSSGDIQFDFFGGFSDTSNGVTAGLVRLRTAKMRLDWLHTSIIAGQDAPFFSPLSPSSIASVAYPPLSYSGNLWTWTPQFRVEHQIILPNDSSISLQVGILDALSGTTPGIHYYRLPQVGERSGGPAYAARSAWTQTVNDRPLTVGVGGYYARQDWGFNRLIDAWVVSTDWDLPVGRWFSLTGEFYRGKAIGGLGGGSASSVLFSGSLDDPGTFVKGRASSGGWAQLKFMPLEKLEFNGAFGEDVPYQSGLKGFFYNPNGTEGSLGRNATSFFNFIYRPRSNLLLSLEYRRLWSVERYGNRLTADHVNLGAGILF